MASERFLSTVNKQITHEFFSAQLYVAMAAYFESENFPGFANFFKMQAEEERFHAMKFFHYVNEMDGRVEIEGLDKPDNNFSSALDVFEKALAHEIKVTSLIYNLMDIAVEEKDYKSISFLNWFIDEQVEEEATMKGLVVRLQGISENPAAMYMLDNELAKRKFQAE